MPARNGVSFINNMLHVSKHFRQLRLFFFAFSKYKGTVFSDPHILSCSHFTACAILASYSHFGYPWFYSRGGRVTD